MICWALHISFSEGYAHSSCSEGYAQSSCSEGYAHSLWGPEGMDSPDSVGVLTFLDDMHGILT